jgi:hypothetical protein
MEYRIITAETLPELQQATQDLLNKGWRIIGNIQTFNETTTLMKFFREMIFDKPCHNENITGNAENLAAIEPKPSDYFYNTKGD